MSPTYAEVALPVPIDSLFTYRVPESLRESALPGVRVNVPFGKRIAVGMIIRISGSTALTEVKEVISVFDTRPVLSAELLRLSAWMSEYYMTPPGEVLANVLPKKFGQREIRPRFRRTVQPLRPQEPDTAIASLTKKQRDAYVRFLEYFEKSQSRLEPAEAKKMFGVSSGVLMKLVERGLATLVEEPLLAAPDYLLHTNARQFTLNRFQQDAIQEICEAASGGQFHSFVLHGVTGSGKTQVYIEALECVLSLGKTGIVLVPEISLTPQIVGRFAARFGDQVAVLHSKLSEGKRNEMWKQTQEGRKKIVIGPRSAVFAPLENLGIIVVDEEHEGTYKQTDAIPRYHARDIAIVRAQFNEAIVVLGSATPSLESMYNVNLGKHRLLRLPERVDEALMPTILVVNMKEERERFFQRVKEDVKGSGKEFPRRIPVFSISQLLRNEIATRLERKEGVLLLLNKRGYSHIQHCRACGYTAKCETCDITLSYHLTHHSLRCHLCGKTYPFSPICPQCGSNEMALSSYGTQQAFEELRDYFPEARIIRMDLDTTSKRGSHVSLLREFGERRADILLGTQMVAKGLDFPHVTLVGVVNADTQLLLPDFRAGERTFQLLTQVAGRSGRSALKGEVVFQTFSPNHYALQAAATNDFNEFLRLELSYRRELNYPPYSRMAIVEFSGYKRNTVEINATRFRSILDSLRPFPGMEILGPSSPLVSCLRKRHRKQIVLKSLKSADPTGKNLHALLHNARERFMQSKGTSATLLTVDIDPYGLF